MAQYWMYLDRIMGTYRDYTPPARGATKKEA